MCLLIKLTVNLSTQPNKLAGKGFKVRICFNCKEYKLLKKVSRMRKGRCRNSTDHAPWKDKAKVHIQPRGTSCHRLNKYASPYLIIFFLVIHSNKPLIIALMKGIRANPARLMSQYHMLYIKEYICFNMLLIFACTKSYVVNVLKWGPGCCTF